MTPISTIVIDDEPLAVQLLESYVTQTPFLQLIGGFNSAIDALEVINNQPIQLLFLDINMPQISGLEFARSINNETRIVFTTAYNQYALDGFKVNALDYLLKPINYADFLRAANRAREWYHKDVPSVVEQSNTDDSIFVKTGYRIERIRYEDLLYVENQKDYVKFFLQDRVEPITSLMNMQTLAEKLPSLFLRVHRSYIVNLGKVKIVERNTIIFGKTYIPISETYRSAFNEYMSQKLL